WSAAFSTLHSGQGPASARRPMLLPLASCGPPVKSLDDTGRCPANCPHMSYDPFARGPSPVGVRTLALIAHARAGRSLPVEVWHPAAGVASCADPDPSTPASYER